ncbi:MAG: hypothetical protein FJ147_00425 [Deltaproteobacteria bacterium]|nr:hypothetical protein [Deltaproteobacteria bacterium]
MRVGFLLNHYAVHQVPHVVPYALELSRHYPEFEVVIACSSRRELLTARAISELYPHHRCRFKRLRPVWYYQFADPFVYQWKFKRKEMVLRNNLAFFRTLNALVAPERHCLRLQRRHGLTNLKFINVRHGAGDREGSFDDRSEAFDLTLLPGQKYVDRLTELDYLRSDSYAVVGWPKFEVVAATPPKAKRFFANDKPIVVYNPHFEQDVSSWQTVGLQVLDFFATTHKYNLIFAPHVILFKRNKRHQAVLPTKYSHLPNILIDTKSDSLTDMTYILAADIYLGDVSSQVYEFLLQPRPCIFLNAHNVQWEDNPYYSHWRLGKVVNDVATELPLALELAYPSHPQFLAKQRGAFAYTFRIDVEGTAARRGAEAIAKFLQATGSNEA